MVNSGQLALCLYVNVNVISITKQIYKEQNKGQKVTNFMKFNLQMNCIVLYIPVFYQAKSMIIIEITNFESSVITRFFQNLPYKHLKFSEQ